mgnify:CR=1 FL=1
MFRHGIRDQTGQISGVQDAELMQGAGCGYVEQLCMAVLHGIVFPRGI